MKVNDIRKCMVFALVYTVNATYVLTSWDNAKCDQWRLAHLSDTSERHYYNLTTSLIRFAKFSELMVNCTRLMKRVEHTLTLYATTQTLFDNDVDLRNLLNMFTWSKVDLSLTFINIKGFNHNTLHNMSQKALVIEKYNSN